MKTNTQEAKDRILGALIFALSEGANMVYFDALMPDSDTETVGDAIKALAKKGA